MLSVQQQACLTAMGITQWVPRQSASKGGVQYLAPLQAHTRVIALWGTPTQWAALSTPAKQCLAGILQATGLRAGEIVPALWAESGSPMSAHLTYLCCEAEGAAPPPPGVVVHPLPTLDALTGAVTGRQECYMILKNARLLQEPQC